MTPRETSIGLRNTCDVALDLGRLGDALAAAEGALAEAERARDDVRTPGSSRRPLPRDHATSTGRHRRGARDDFAAATALEDRADAVFDRGQLHARHHLDLGDIAACRAITEAGLRVAQRNDWNFEFPGWHALFARIALAEGQDPSRAHRRDPRLDRPHRRHGMDPRSP